MDYVDARAYFSLRYMHIPEGTLSHVAAQFTLNVRLTFRAQFFKALLA